MGDKTKPQFALTQKEWEEEMICKRISTNILVKTGSFVHEFTESWKVLKIKVKIKNMTSQSNVAIILLRFKNFFYYPLC